MRRGLRCLAILLLAVLVPGAAPRALELIALPGNAFALVGELGQRSPANLGSNSTHGFVVTGAGVVVVDPGATKKGAEEIERIIRSVTSAPIVGVINTGGQDHRWLGNAHFKQLGAQVFASAAAVADQRSRFDLQWSMLRTLVGDEGLQGTEPAFADRTFDERLTLRFGTTEIELIASGGAHTPGDTIVWLPQERIAFAGDVVYADRLLGVLPVSHSRRWLEAFGRLEGLSPSVVVPGHGRPTSLDEARRQTRDYIRHLRATTRAALDAGRNIEATLKADQSAFAGLAGFDQLARPNLQQVYIEMEFD